MYYFIYLGLYNQSIKINISQKNLEIPNGKSCKNKKHLFIEHFHEQKQFHNKLFSDIFHCFLDGS